MPQLVSSFGEHLLTPADFGKQLLGWYAQHRRPLPWRATKDPYAIWVSEILLQQTRIDQGIAYYHRFMARYPTIDCLASASQEEVLRVWQGLGYYRRALNLHACARHLVKKSRGCFPKSEQGLLALPGIGPYTAAAVGSIAFGLPLAVVDGNVYRVFTRLFGLYNNIMLPATQKKISKIAQHQLCKKAPGDYNQALMEFGALQCRPHKPICATCPFQPFCVAYHTQAQAHLPIRVKNLKRKKRFLHYLVFKQDDCLWLKKRIKNEIWQGLYDFYLVETSKPTPFIELEDPLAKSVKKAALPWSEYVNLKSHQLTHQILYSRFSTVELKGDFAVQHQRAFQAEGLLLFSKEAMLQLPLPRLILHYLERHPLS